MYNATERVWTCNSHGDVWPRPAKLQLEDSSDEELCTKPPTILHINGLKPADFAVCFEVETIDEPDGQEPEVQGYLVSAVDAEGDGILVLGNSIEQDPASYMNDRLADMAIFVGEEQLGDFGLHALYAQALDHQIRRHGAA